MKTCWGLISVVLISSTITSACGELLEVSDVHETGFFESAGARLHYIVDVPATGSGPFPGVVLGHGSGPKTIRDLDGFARKLVAQGFAVMRFDKRGTGESEGEYRRVSRQFPARDVFPELAGDLEAAVEHLAAFPFIDQDRIGMMGESQAGWIIPLAASRSPLVSFIILLSGPTVDVGVNIRYEVLTQEQGLSVEAAYQRLQTDLHSPDWDPLPILEAFAGDGLWIYGDQDALVPTRNSVEILKALQAKGKPYIWHVLPGHDHGLRPVNGATRMDYWPFIFDWFDRI